MKKIYSIMIAAAVAFAFTSCEETTPDNGTDGTEQGGGGEPEDPNTLTYGGVTYKTVTLSNGQTWMAEPLRYIPEGMTVSSDPSENAHIWYSYTFDAEGNPVADETTVEERGYLYDMYAALGGVEITTENCETFEGVQGICPDGWHIPTWEEYFLLCGKSNEMENGNGASSNTEALFYDSEYDGGKVLTANELGWNVVFSGVRQKTTFTATNTQYVKTAISETNCTIENFYGAPAMTYYISSTFDKMKEDSKTGEISSIYFMSMMTTFTKKYSEG